ncbi:histidine kinase [Streptomonospora sp. S1-112]|uniref:histidine kinase n=1 Tax=Streptomonospora mangrovi TaxID=2883123 RepID=A0A9X3SCX3_9ACTN|nr:sensor histidine kinase [Streptomonospora mangrovi]MDA0564178.1 histidine kinase [Streptomonospora mangrovi]
MSSERGPRPGPRHAGRARGRAAPFALSLAAFCGSFYPLLLPPSHAALLSGFAAVPGAAGAALVGAAAAAAAWGARRSLWPLVALAAADAVLRATGPVTALALYLVAARGRRPALAAGAVMTVLSALPRPGVGWDSALGSAALFVWLPLALGAWTAARAQVLAGLRERADRLESERAALAARARAEERTRIARDMHDVVAHRVSLIVLRAGALEVGAADEATAAEAELIRRTGQDALLQLRHVLGVLRRTGDPEPGAAGDAAAEAPEALRPPPTLADVPDLVARSRSAGVPVELEGTAGHGADTADTAEEHAAYRVVQEALTNVHKHAGAAATRVTVHRAPGAVEVAVENSPPDRTPLDLAGTGVGLIGLRERVEALGGEFHAGPTGSGGFRVWARLPT